jgi:DNA-binding MarR family transcriptional regulator
MQDNTDRLIAEALDFDQAVQRRLRDRWPETWLQINLPLGSTRALLAIEGRDARTPGRVAEALGVSRTTVTGLLDRLESEGLLTRAIDPNDRRCFLLALTPQGRDVIGQIESHRRAQLAEALTRLSPGEVVALRTGLAALAGALDPAPAPAAAR